MPMTVHNFSVPESWPLVEQWQTWCQKSHAQPAFTVRQFLHRIHFPTWDSFTLTPTLIFLDTEQNLTQFRPNISNSCNGQICSQLDTSGWILGSFLLCVVSTDQIPGTNTLDAGDFMSVRISIRIVTPRTEENVRVCPNQHRKLKPAPTTRTFCCWWCFWSCYQEGTTCQTWHINLLSCPKCQALLSLLQTF